MTSLEDDSQVRVVYRDTRQSADANEDFTSTSEPQAAKFSSGFLNQRLQEVSAEAQQHQQAAEPTHIQQLLDGLLPADEASEASSGPSARQGPLLPLSPQAQQFCSLHQPIAQTPAAPFPTPNLATLLNSHGQHPMQGSNNSPASARPQLKTAARFKQLPTSQQASSSAKQKSKDARQKLQSNSKKFSIRDPSNLASMIALDTITPLKQRFATKSQLPSSPSLPSGGGRVSISQSIQMLTGSPPASGCPAPSAVMKSIDKPATLLDEVSTYEGDTGAQQPHKELALPFNIPAKESPMPDRGPATPAPLNHQRSDVGAADTVTPTIGSTAAALPEVAGRKFLASVFKEGLNDGPTQRGRPARQGSAVNAQGLLARMQAILQREQQALPSRAGKPGFQATPAASEHQPAHASLHLSAYECQREGHLIKARCHLQMCQGQEPLPLPCCNGPDCMIKAGQDIFAFVQAEAWHSAGLAVHEAFEVLPVWTCWQTKSVSSPVVLCRNVTRLAA
ncbi:hypothetical protein WJX74_006387 [Apatococcus lobatus]|uniref:Uncharacterized protein n=1 Tax=Apatococcus lobatus TaxID=904363 RepID=A0AAW1QKV1_9CHLO